MGTGMSPSVLVHSEVQAPYSFAWFCPECGRIWAKAVVDGAHFMVANQPCEQHKGLPNYFIVPGSLWLSLRPEFIQSLSREVLEREFRIHLAHYDRYHK